MRATDSERVSPSSLQCTREYFRSARPKEPEPPSRPEFDCAICSAVGRQRIRHAPAIRQKLRQAAWRLCGPPRKRLHFWSAANAAKASKAGSRHKRWPRMVRKLDRRKTGVLPSAWVASRGRFSSRKPRQRASDSTGSCAGAGPRHRTQNPTLRPGAQRDGSTWLLSRRRPFGTGTRSCAPYSRLS